MFTAPRLREGKPEKIGEQKVSFGKAGEIKEVTLKHGFKEFPAIFDIEARAYAGDGTLLAIFNTPLGIEASTIAYRMLPQIPKTDEQGPQINLIQQIHKNTAEGINWADKLPGEKFKVTAVVPYQACNEAEIMLSKIDSTLTTSLIISQGRPQNTSGDYFGLLAESDIQDNLDAILHRMCCTASIPALWIYRG